MRALIVDNNEFARAKLKEAMERIGLEVVGEAYDGLSAIDDYASLRPDIVAMEVTMSGMDGIETTRKIREEDPDAKILMVTALASCRKLMDEALEAGAWNYLGKPFTSDELEEAIEWPKAEAEPGEEPIPGPKPKRKPKRL